MISLDRMCTKISKRTDDFVGEPVLEDTVAEAQQVVDGAHELQRLVQSRNIAMNVRNDAELQSFFPAVQPPSTIKVVPVQKLASSDARNRIAFATSGGSPQRFKA